VGATAGGCISLVVSGSEMLAVATVVCALTTGYTYFHADRRLAVELARQERYRYADSRLPNMISTNGAQRIPRTVCACGAAPVHDA
jgi:hypothetical protein